MQNQGRHGKTKNLSRPLFYVSCACVVNNTLQTLARWAMCSIFIIGTLTYEEALLRFVEKVCLPRIINTQLTVSPFSRYLVAVSTDRCLFICGERPSYIPTQTRKSLHEARL